MEFPLRKDSYAKCEEEEKTEKGVGESEEKSCAARLVVSLSKAKVLTR